MNSIMFLDQFGGMGGGQKILCQLVSESKKHWDVTVFIPEGQIVEKLRQCGAEVNILPSLNLTCGRKTAVDIFKYGIWSMRAMYQIFKMKCKPDLIYTIAPRLFFISIMVSAFYQIPIIFHLESIFEKGLSAIMMRFLCKFPNVIRVFCASKSILKTVDNLNGRSMLLYNFVDPEFLEEPHHNDVRESLKPCGEVYIIGCFGRISPTKGQMIFLREGIALLKEKNEFYFLIVGAGGFEVDGVKLEMEIKKIINESQFKDRWNLTGWRNDIIELMDACDVVVVPSLWQEPFGLVAIEGMARGKVVVASKRGGLAEIIENGVDGFIFEPENRGELKNLLIGLDKKRMREIGYNAREKVKKQFSYDAFMPRWRDEVAQIMQGSNCL